MRILFAVTITALFAGGCDMLDRKHVDIYTSNELNGFLQIAECLSIRANDLDKERMIRTYRANLLPSNYEVFEKTARRFVEDTDDYIRDNKFIIAKARELCPNSVELLEYFTEADWDKDRRFGAYDITIRVIAAQVVSPEERRIIFENEHQMIGSSRIY
jgi:hypothetical protein